MPPPTVGGTVRASFRVVLGRAVDPCLHTPLYETAEPPDYRDHLPSGYIPEAPPRIACDLVIWISEPSERRKRPVPPISNPISAGIAILITGRGCNAGL